MKVTRISLLAALIAGAMFVASPALHAQEAKDSKEATKKGEGRGKGPEAAKERLDKMAEDLKLTEDQKKKVGEVLKAQTDKMRELRSQGGTPEDNREKMRALRDESDKKIKEILTAEQFAKWEKDRPQRGQGGPGKRGEKKAEKQ